MACRLVRAPSCSLDHREAPRLRACDAQLSRPAPGCAPLSALPVRNGRSPHTVVTMGPDSCAHSRYARLLVYRAPRLFAAAALSASSCVRYAKMIDREQNPTGVCAPLRVRQQATVYVWR